MSLKKTIFLLIVSVSVAFFLRNAVAQSALPSCVGDDRSLWTNCYGKFSDSDKLFEGEFKDGKRNGYGLAKINNGTRFEGVYENDVVVNGIATFKNGSLYTGQFNSKGLFHGQGKYIFADGSFYEGEYRDGKQNGLGVFTFLSGDVFKGEFVDDKKTGKGLYIYANGDFYESYYENNIPISLISYKFIYKYNQYDLSDYRHIKSNELTKRSDELAAEYDRNRLEYILLDLKEKNPNKEAFSVSEIKLKNQRDQQKLALKAVAEDLKKWLKTDNQLNSTQKTFLQIQIFYLTRLSSDFDQPKYESYLQSIKDASSVLIENYSIDHPYFLLGQDLNLEHAITFGPISTINDAVNHINKPYGILGRAYLLNIENESNNMVYCTAKSQTMRAIDLELGEFTDKNRYDLSHEKLISLFPCSDREKQSNLLRDYGLHAQINGFFDIAESAYIYLEKSDYSHNKNICEGVPCEVIDKKNYAYLLNRMGKNEEALNKLEHAKKLCSQFASCVTEQANLQEAKLRILGDDIALEAKIKNDIEKDELSLFTKSSSFESLSLIAENRNDLTEAIFLQKIAIYHAYEDFLKIIKSTNRGKDVPVSDLLERNLEERYRRLVKLLIDSNRLSEADEIMSSIKGVEKIEFIKRSDPSSVDLISEARLNKYEKLWMDKYKATLNNAKNTSNNGLVTEYLKTLQKDFSKKKNVADVETIQSDSQKTIARLSNRTALLRFYVMRDWLDVIITTANTQTSKRIYISEKLLNQKISEFRSLLTNPYSKPKEKSKELYKLIIEPLLKDFEKQKINNLILSVDKNLRYLPFAALHDGKAYLIEKISLSIYQDNLKKGERKKISKDWKVAGFGVTKKLGEFQSLPSVRDEIESIIKVDEKGLLPGKIYLDNAFTADQLKNSGGKDFSFLHISSHFVFSPGTEENSYLLLGDGNKLSLLDMRSQNYKFPSIDLVTLSACDTAQGGGKDETGKEIDGLADLLIRNGSGSVMATLWKVEDSSTAKLMKDFYTFHTQNSLSKTESLRQAQLKMIMNDIPFLSKITNKNISYEHPFFWAPFILISNEI